MRIASLHGRAHLVLPGGDAVDVATATGGALPADPMLLLDRWPEALAWGSGVDGPGVPLDRAALQAPVPRPRQVFAVASNYRDRPAVVSTDAEMPVVFTKFPSCIAAPDADLVLPTATVDWEVELVAVVGRPCRAVAPEDAWSAVAGLTVGQDFSERGLQLHGATTQFCLGKSFPGFGPIGPVLVTPDELPDPDALHLRCTVNGEVVQDACTDAMIRPVSELLARLSEVCTLYPGDLVFTGTPAGLGMSRTPPRYLAPGDLVVSGVAGIGELRTRCRR